ncbi:MAG: Phosphoribosylglycinamide formyltransferase, partial [Thermodesulfobacteriota bacterium]|nr:Phosphoribosylglycinamide formyltransferase [Thermodesulfobacteriota bacterium]
RLPIGIIVSGSGSNLQAIIDHIEESKLDAVIKVVISNNPQAFALERCRRHNIPYVIINHKDYPLRDDFDQQLIYELQSRGVELVIMAGFMRILTARFLSSFPMRIMNIHPALLPAFPGLHVQRQAVEYGVRFSGCTVHFADDGVDTGPIVIQSVVPVYEDDNEEMLAQRILKEEHKIYPQAIQWFAEGRLEVKGRKVHLRAAKELHVTPQHNPSLVIR